MFLSLTICRELERRGKVCQVFQYSFSTNRTILGNNNSEPQIRNMLSIYVSLKSRSGSGGNKPARHPFTVKDRKGEDQ